MRTGRRNIKDGGQYNLYFPKSKGEFVEVKGYAQLSDTINLMQEVIQSTLNDTKLISQKLKAQTPYETCKNIWTFCFYHLQYKRDAEGKEQVRRPSRSWQDRHTGVDCDCMTVFVGSILSNLKIPFLIRLTNYKKASPSEETDEFEHVYPVALINNQEVVIDCVVHAFDYQVPYKKKQDIKMNLQYLNGIDGDEFSPNATENILGELFGFDFSPSELGILIDDSDLEGLDGRAERKAKRQERRAERKARPFKERVKRVLHVVNRLNPATGLLRAGILASLKLNLMNVAGKLRFSYLSPQQAEAKGMNMSKYGQLTAIRQKIEKIFFGAGGKIENFKKAILTGRGNRDKKVALNGLEGSEANVNDWQDLQQILGLETYRDEFSDDSINGVGELGSVTAGAAIASASGIIGTIAGLLKTLGDLFKKGTPENQAELQQEEIAKTEDSTRLYSQEKIEQLVQEESITLPTKPLAPLPSNMSTQLSPSGNYEIAPSNPQSPLVETTDDSDKPDEEKKGVVAWVKENPFLTAGIGVLAITSIALIVKATKKKDTKGLSGVKSAKKKATKKGKVKTPTISKYIKKVELL